jgi:3-methyladenine DNA glycosylase/8-oxoguanine DNA glycosylase
MQNEVMGVLVQNKARRGVERPQDDRHQDMNTSYSNFMVTHFLILSGEWTRWRQMIGSTPPSQSTVCYTTQNTRRLCMPPSSLEV